MERKLKISLGIIGMIILIALLALGLYYKFTPRLDYDLKLTEDKLIINQTLIDMIVINNTSPLGNNLTEMNLVALEEDIIAGDEKVLVSKNAYYTCTQNEHNGWIYLIYSDSGEAVSKLYGPYSWCNI